LHIAGWFQPRCGYITLRTSLRAYYGFKGENTVCLAIPGKLMSKTEVDGMLCGRVEFGGIVRTACMDLLPEANVGDYVLVHVGFAISRIDEEDAKATLAYLEELGELQAELGPLEASRI
jgi:hydrogenase expression/formation protein HypC